MSSIFIIKMILLLGISNAEAICALDAAVEKVNHVCQELESKGEHAKKLWPQSLLYENCGDNYVWIQDMSKEIKMLIHPVKRRMDGMSLVDYVDENKFYLGREAHKAAKENPRGAWVEYVWIKPGATKASEKKAFVRRCKIKNDIEVVIGSGVWKEDVGK